MKRILAAVLTFLTIGSSSYAAMQALQQAPASNHADVRATINGNATKSNANFTEHEDEINTLSATKVEKGGIILTTGASISGAGTVADPYILPGKAWVAQPSAPADLNTIWIDTDQNNEIKVHLSGVWTVVGTAGTSGGSYTLPAATALVLGGVKQGTGVTIAADGTLTPDYTQIQRRAASCDPGSSIRSIAQDGTVTCETDDNGATNLPDGTATGDTPRWEVGTGWVVGTYSVDLSATTDLTIQGSPLVDDTALASATNKIYSAKKVSDLDALKVSITDIDSKAELETLIGESLSGGTGSSTITALGAIPYSNVACTSSGYYSSTLYLCVGGYYTQKVTTTAHSNVQSSGINDTFATNTTTSYTTIFKDVNGHAWDAVNFRMNGESNVYWSTSAYHNTPLASANHTVKAKLATATGSAAQLIFRCNGAGTSSTGWNARPDTTNMRIETFSAGTYSWAATVNYTGGKTWPEGTNHLAGISVTGTTLSVFVDWNDDNDFGDADETLTTTQTIAASPTGLYVGATWEQNGGTVWIDNFEASSL